MRITSLASAICLVVLLAGCGINQREQADAESTTFTMDQPSDYPVLNRVTDHPLIGDERNFLRVATINEDGSPALEDYQIGDCAIEAGKSYIVMVACHNAAAAGLEDSATIEHATLILAYPEVLEAEAEVSLSAIFSYDSDGDSVFRGDEITLQSDADVRLELSPVGPTDTSPSCIVMYTNYDCSQFKPLAPVEVTIEGGVTQTLGIAAIKPGYENSGFFFYRLDAVAVE